MIHHRELAFALAQGGAAPYLARLLRVITQVLNIEGALLVRLEGKRLDIVASWGLPVHLLTSMELSDEGYKLLRSGGRFAKAAYDPVLRDKPFVATPPYWRSLIVTPVASPETGVELRFVGGSADPQPPSVSLLTSELFHDLLRVLSEQLRLIFDLAMAVTDANRAEINRSELNRVAEPQHAFDFSARDDVVVRFLLDTLVVKNRTRSRNGLSYYALRAWRKAIKNEQIAAIKALKAAPHAVLEAQICHDVRHWIASTFGAKRFDAIVPVPCGHSGADCLSVRAARMLGAELGVPVVEAFEPLAVAGSSHPKANVARPRMRLRQQVDGDILLIDDIATSGSHVEEAARKLRHEGNSVIAVSWIADG
jgi:hypothetical protein